MQPSALALASNASVKAAQAGAESAANAQSLSVPPGQRRAVPHLARGSVHREEELVQGRSGDGSGWTVPPLWLALQRGRSCMRQSPFRPSQAPNFCRTRERSGRRMPLRAMISPRTPACGWTRVLAPELRLQVKPVWPWFAWHKVRPGFGPGTFEGSRSPTESDP